MVSMGLILYYTSDKDVCLTELVNRSKVIPLSLCINNNYAAGLHLTELCIYYIT